MKRRIWHDHSLSRACLLAMAALAAPAWPQQAPPQDLTKSTLEDLMNITVTSVAKKEEKLSQTAAAVFVITQDDIRNSGTLNLPDVLRMAPGVDVAQISSNKWAISIRGLNALYSNELLVLEDGRTVYTPTTGGVFWDVLDVPLEDIERIELIRGPGGALWGTNAVNGIINIITRKAADTRGAMLVGGGGNKDQGFGTMQYGAAAGNKTDYRVFAKYFNEDESPGLAGVHGGDGWHVLRGGFRADSDVSARNRLTFSGDVYDGREGVTSPVLPSVTAPGPVEKNGEVNLSGGYFQAIWNYAHSDHSDTSLQFSYDRYERDDSLDETRGTFDASFEHHIAVHARHDLLWGLEYRNSGSHSDGSLFFSLAPADIRTELFSTFVQDQISLITNRVLLTVGTKLEYNHYSAFNMMPTARLAWSPNGRNTLWTAVSRGVRTPADTDASIRLNLATTTGPGGAPALISQIGNPNFKDENMVAFEAGYRASFRPGLSLDLALYYNDYTSQQTDEPAPAFFEPAPAPSHFVFPSTFQNLMHGEASGIEVFANWRVTNRWTIGPGYAFEQVHMHLNADSEDTSSVSEADGSAPLHSAQLRSHIALPHGFAWNATAYFVGRIADPAVPSYTRLDTNISWQAAEGLSFSLVGENLLQNTHLEYSDPNVDSTLVKRSVYAKVAWIF